MVYPILLCVVGFAIVIGLFTFVMPGLKSMFNMDTVPGITKFLFAMSDFIIHQWPVAIMIVVAIIIGIGAMRVLKPVQVFVSRCKVTMPVVGKLYVKILAASFCRTMSSVFSSGMSLITSIELTANCLNNEYVTSQMDQVIDEIRTGGALSKAIEKTEIFPQMMITMLNVGEESGALDEILEKTSDFYDQEADDAIGKLVALMEPGMIVILGGVVGLVAVGLMAPIFGMYDNIG
jgi:type IV pilus assembly protein PilC